MSEGGAKQRLAAILAADGAGYSRLMEADEQATMAALDAARGVFKSEIEANHGRVINMAGDSVLALFDTAAGAVTAALAAQQALDEYARDESETKRLRFRIGIHLGDVIENADGDVHGDGVNIAARLQSIAKPGGVVVSDAVRGAVKARLAAKFENLGAQRVKNIADPVHAFSVMARPGVDEESAATRRPSRTHVAWIAGICVLAAVALAGAWKYLGRASEASAPVAATAPASAPTGERSIAVLPFDNMSGEADKAYFADGMTEDLITDLSKVRGLVVIARNSTFEYKGKARDVREIGKALNARYVLEGSVRRSGDTVRVNAQLIDAASGAHIWADRYDGQMKDIFGLQDTITRNVVKALAIELTQDDSDRVANRGTGNVQAYDVLLRGWQHYLEQTPEGFKAAIADFRQAAELDPGYSRAYAALASIYWEAYTRYWGPALGLSRHTQYEAEQYLAKAMHDPTPLAHEVSSAMLLNSQQYDDAVAEARRAVAADPNDADGYIALAGALGFSGKPADALDAVEKAMRLNPHYPSSYAYQRGLALFGLNRLDEAAASLERAMEINRNDYWSQRLLLSIYGLRGRRDDAQKLIGAMTGKEQRGQYAAYDPLTIRAVTYWYPFSRPDDAKRFATGLAKAGVVQD